MLIAINHTLKLITRKKHDGCVDPSTRGRAGIPSVALPSLSILLIAGGPSDCWGDSWVYSPDVIHSPLQPHLQTTKQETATAQAALNPPIRAETLNWPDRNDESQSWGPAGRAGPKNHPVPVFPLPLGLLECSGPQELVGLLSPQIWGLICLLWGSLCLRPPQNGI